jgi:hypothetical protein
VDPTGHGREVDRRAVDNDRLELILRRGAERAAERVAENDRLFELLRLPDEAHIQG